MDQTVFQMPVLVLALARMGVVTAGLMLRHFKYAVLIIAVLGALLSPGGDPIGQFVMAAPMLVLMWEHRDRVDLSETAEGLATEQ